MNRAYLLTAGLLLCAACTWKPLSAADLIPVRIKVEPLTTFPAPAYSIVPAYRTVGGRIYFFGGHVPDGTWPGMDAVRIYDIATNAWTVSPITLPYGIMMYGTNGIFTANHFYVGPGFTAWESAGWGSHNRLIDVDLESGTAIERAAFPLSAVWGENGCEADGHVFFFGGYFGGQTSSIFEYDRSSDRLTEVANMLAPGSAVRATFAADGWIYYWRGASQYIEKFHPITHEVLSTGIELPEPPVDGWNPVNAVHVSSEKSIYFIGVRDGKVFRFNYEDLTVTDTGAVVNETLWGLPATQDAENERVAYVLGGARDSQYLTLYRIEIAPPDTTPPVIDVSVQGTMGAGRWFLGDVHVEWLVEDRESGVAQSFGCEPQTLTSDTAGTTLTCTASSSGGSSSQSATIRIDRIPPVTTAYARPEPNSSGWNSTGVTVTWDCADATSGVQAGSVPNPAVLTLDGAAQLVRGACTDIAGNTSTARVVVNIDTTLPVVESLTASLNPAPIGSATALSASVADKGGSNLASAEFTVDGGTPAQMTPISGTSAVATADLPPFPTAGVYTVCAHAHDIAGNAAKDNCIFLPVYDPSAGYITGGGWIDSPAGAYSANAALSGKAAFGFVAKYQKGANVPSGQTQFQFRVADLEFRSTSYEWLVVAGYKAQYKGIGAINGIGGYSFLISAVDGQLMPNQGADRFRIKIWGPDGVVYDNEGGAVDSAAPVTTVAAGSIVIHP